MQLQYQTPNYILARQVGGRHANCRAEELSAAVPSSKLTTVFSPAATPATTRSTLTKLFRVQRSHLHSAAAAVVTLPSLLVQVVAVLGNRCMPAHTGQQLHCYCCPAAVYQPRTPAPANDHSLQTIHMLIIPRSTSTTASETTMQLPSHTAYLILWQWFLITQVAGI